MHKTRDGAWHTEIQASAITVIFTNVEVFNFGRPLSLCDK